MSELSDDISHQMYASIIDRLAQDPPRLWSPESHQVLLQAFQQRFHSTGSLIPVEISSSLHLFDLLNSSDTLVRMIKKHGPKATESLEACRTLLEPADLRDISYQQVANSLLFMVIARDDPPYDPSTFVAALREHRGGQRLDWQDVVHAFDRDGLNITKSQFKRLFDALLPLAQEYENFDIQLLWGGDWHHEETQLAFVAAFVSFAEDELDASQIPRLRKAFTLEDFADASDEVKAYAETAVRHPLVSVDATKALFNMVFRSSDTYTHAQNFGVVDTVINPKMDLFVCSVSAVPKPWSALQDQAIKQLVASFFWKPVLGRAFALHVLWKRDSPWLVQRLQQYYAQRPVQLVQILELAQEHGWLSDLIGVTNEFSLDLATLAHGRNLFDLEPWLQQIEQAMSRNRFIPALSTFLKNKADDDLRVQREDSEPVTVPLTIKTVFVLLNFLVNEGLSEEDRAQMQRLCITAYPRLINYGGDYDAIIEENGLNGNSLSPDADGKMQEHYKLMYSGEKQVREVVEDLQTYKTSDDPADQELFACMIFGLFDEYNCFGEYPLDALATTAVLFGSIINFNLLSTVALQVAISMVLEAVKDYPPNESMYKFGLQALLHFQDRLEEWLSLSAILVQVPGLQGTPIYPRLEKILRDARNVADGQSNDQEAAGAVDDFLAPDSKIPEFTCLTVDPPTRSDFYKDPDEQVQEVVLFTLNNVSERNLSGKTNDLKSKLQEEHNQWFAHYLVESRIKPQPNYHQLYMDLLNQFDDKVLWTQVLRETYICAIRMLNSESTMSSSNERTHLKNLGAWLGSMTLARNQALRFRNISFRDLLVEAHNTQRLLVAIPFTCKVLATAASSVVFRPPCAWTMEILQILVELYEHADLKLNLKFEIEVLCKALDVDHKEIEPSDIIRSIPQMDEEQLPPVMPDGLEGFNELALLNFNRSRSMAERFLPSSMVPEFAEFASLLKHNYSLPPSNSNIQARIRHLLTVAAERAVSEIIGPVVERSVTIAAISTSQLIAKDFALEPDAERYRDSAHITIRKLAGSLAGVTCKEPLRASMQNSIAVLRQEVPEQALPQGSVLMFVNDNIEIVCSIVQKAAESASPGEIDALIEDAVHLRKSTSFVEPLVSQWANYIPEPFRPSPGGLNSDQLAVYGEFARPGRAASGHNNSISQDSVRQVPDVLQDQFSTIPNLPTPAEAPILPSQAQHQPNHIPQASVAQHLMNGYPDTSTLRRRLSDLVQALYQAASGAIEEDSTGSIGESASVQELWSRLRDIMAAAGTNYRDEAAYATAGEVVHLLETEPLNSHVADFLADRLHKLCSISDRTAREVHGWAIRLPTLRPFKTSIIAAVVKNQLLDIRSVDLFITRELQMREPSAIKFFGELVDTILLSDPPSALRADLAGSLMELTRWMNDVPANTEGQALMRMLQDNTTTDSASSVDDPTPEEEAQFDYVFDEWIRLQHNSAPLPTLLTFIHQLHAKKLVQDREASAVFFRACVGSSIFSFEQEEIKQNGNIDDAYLKIDALARLIVLMASHQGKLNEIEKTESPAFFDGLLTLLVLIMAQQYQKSIERFNSKVFFRLFSSIMHEIHSPLATIHGNVQDMYHALGRCLLKLRPQLFPAFAFQWLSLHSHRLFMPALLKSQDQMVSKPLPSSLTLLTCLQGWKIYCDLLETQMAYIGGLLTPIEVSHVSKDFYRGTLKLLLVLHHDFADFLAENHFQILRHIPTHCTQMRSLVVSACPTSVHDLPDPFTEGLKVDRVEDMKRSPVVRADVESILVNAGIYTAVDELLSDSGGFDQLEQVLQAITTPSGIEAGHVTPIVQIDTTMLNALVLFIVKHAEGNNQQRALTFSASSAHARFMGDLIEKLNPEGRYQFISAIANQLRYPSVHTHYFMYALLHLFRAGQTTRLALDIQQNITRVFTERIVVHRPHPWGLMVTIIELLKNRTYRFWELPFVKSTPEVSWL